MPFDGPIGLLIVECISTQFGVPKSTILETTTASDVAGWDSFGHAQLIMQIEMRLGSELPLEALLDAQDVGGLVALVERARA